MSEIIDVIINNGYHPLAVDQKTKGPLYEDWQIIAQTPEGCRKTFRDHPTMLAVGHVHYDADTTTDWDNHSEKPNGASLFEKLMKERPEMFAGAIIERSRSGGYHASFHGTSGPKTCARLELDGKVIDIEVRRENNQTVIPPTEGYSYISERTHLNTKAADLPALPQVILDGIARYEKEMKAAIADIKKPEGGRAFNPDTDKLEECDLVVSAQCYYKTYLDGAVEGNRHNRGISLAKKLYGHVELGMSRSEAIDLIKDYGRRTEREAEEIKRFILDGGKDPDRDIWLYWKAIWTDRKQRDPAKWGDPYLRDSRGRDMEITPEKVRAAEAIPEYAQEPLSIEARARDILKNGDPVDFIMEQYHRMHVGDDNHGRLLLVSIGCQSVFNSDGIHPGTSGESGKGKTDSCQAMAHLCPPEYVVAASVSPKALFYKEGVLPGYNHLS
jgi:hypothetical protein